MGTASDSVITAARWSLRLFGGFELRALATGERVAIPGKRDRVLLAYLALSPTGRSSRPKLATLLWDDATDHAGTRVLRLDPLRIAAYRLFEPGGTGPVATQAARSETQSPDDSTAIVVLLPFTNLSGDEGQEFFPTA